MNIEEKSACQIEETANFSKSNIRNTNKKILICAAVVFILVVFAILVNPYFLNECRYARANQLIEQCKYTEAYYLLKDCRGNKNAQNLLENFLVVNSEITTYSYNTGGELEVIYKYKYDEFGNNVVADEYSNDGRLNDRTVMEYNENGDMTLLVAYGEDGTVIYQRKWLYDSNGKYIETIKSDKDGNVDERTTSEYDDRGNPTLVLQYVSYLTMPYRRTEYQYNEEGKMILEVEYNKDGQVVYKNVKEYDEKGNICLSVDYGFDGKMERRVETVYDEMENALYRTQYDGEDNVVLSEYLEQDEQGDVVLWITYDENGQIEGKTVYEYGKLTISESNYDSEGVLLYKMVEKYNRYGEYLGYEMYHENDEKFAFSVYSYDKSGNILQFDRRGGDGEIKEKTVYEYDEKGNKVRATDYIQDRIIKVEEFATPIIKYCPKDN